MKNIADGLRKIQARITVARSMAGPPESWSPEVREAFDDLELEMQFVTRLNEMGMFSDRAGSLVLLEMEFSHASKAWYDEMVALVDQAIPSGRR